MKKRLGLVGGAMALIALIAVAGISLASGGDIAAPTTLHLHGKHTEDNFVGNGGAGSQFFFHADLFDAKNKKIGFYDGICTFGVSPTDMNDCSVTASFADGKLVLGGVAGDTTKGPQTFAIVGGTGHYENARGQVIVKATGELTESIEIDLLP